jgi:hypothetical protein
MKFGFKPILPLIAELQSKFSRLNAQSKLNNSDCYGYMVNALRLLGSNVYIDSTELVTVTKHTGQLPDSFYLAKSIWLCEPAQNVQQVIDLGRSLEERDYKKLALLRPADSTTMFLCRDYQVPGVSPADMSFRILSPSNVIKTSFKNGTLLVSYYSLPVDNDGLILYPDSENVAEALKAYTLKQVFQEMFYMGELKETVWVDIVRQWDDYCESARNDLKAIDPSEVVYLIQKQHARLNRFKFDK